jgi:two-component system, cell cycle sensor histidine kinase DivJ
VRVTGVAASLTTLWNYVDGLVHQDARRDALTLARHRAFIAPRLIGGCAVLAAFPLYVALRGTPNMLEAALFAWMVVPLALVYFLSRTGRYKAAHIFSAIALTGLVAFLIWYSGAWSIAAWLLIVPLELALAGSPLLKREAEGYRHLTQSMTDVLLRHGRNGAVTFISPAATNLFTATPDELMGRGLFDRVHVADRPAYLSALADAAAGRERSLEFRLRTDQPTGPRFIWVEMRCAPLKSGKDAQEAVAVLRDISARKAQDETLNAARAELESAQVALMRIVGTTQTNSLSRKANAVSPLDLRPQVRKSA